MFDVKTLCSRSHRHMHTYPPTHLKEFTGHNSTLHTTQGYMSVELASKAPRPPDDNSMARCAGLSPHRRYLRQLVATRAAREFPGTFDVYMTPLKVPTRPAAPPSASKSSRPAVNVLCKLSASQHAAEDSAVTNPAEDPVLLPELPRAVKGPAHTGWKSTSRLGAGVGAMTLTHPAAPEHQTTVACTSNPSASHRYRRMRVDVRAQSPPKCLTTSFPHLVHRNMIFRQGTPPLPPFVLDWGAEAKVDSHNGRGGSAAISRPVASTPVVSTGPLAAAGDASGANRNPQQSPARPDISGSASLRTTKRRGRHRYQEELLHLLFELGVFESQKRSTVETAESLEREGIRQALSEWAARHHAGTRETARHQGTRETGGLSGTGKRAPIMRSWIRSVVNGAALRNAWDMAEEMARVGLAVAERCERLQLDAMSSEEQQRCAVMSDESVSRDLVRLSACQAESRRLIERLFELACSDLQVQIDTLVALWDETRERSMVAHSEAVQRLMLEMRAARGRLDMEQDAARLRFHRVSCNEVCAHDKRVLSAVRIQAVARGRAARVRVHKLLSTPELPTEALRAALSSRRAWLRSVSSIDACPLTPRSDSALLSPYAHLEQVVCRLESLLDHEGQDSQELLISGMMKELIPLLRDPATTPIPTDIEPDAALHLCQRIVRLGLFVCEGDTGNGDDGLDGSWIAIVDRWISDTVKDGLSIGINAAGVIGEAVVGDSMVFLDMLLRCRAVAPLDEKEAVVLVDHILTTVTAHFASVQGVQTQQTLDLESPPPMVGVVPLVVMLRNSDAFHLPRAVTVLRDHTGWHHCVEGLLVMLNRLESTSTSAVRSDSDTSSTNSNESISIVVELLRLVIVELLQCRSAAIRWCAPCGGSVVSGRSLLAEMAVHASCNHILAALHERYIQERDGVGVSSDFASALMDPSPNEDGIGWIPAEHASAAANLPALPFLGRSAAASLSHDSSASSSLERLTQNHTQ